MAKFDKEFKQQAVEYVKSHPELKVTECARNLGINVNTLHTWLNKDKANEEFRGSGNYESDEAKEIARLKKDLQAHKDALNILKNNKDIGRRPVDLYIQVELEAERVRKMENRQISINSVLPLLSISSSGYYDYFNRKDRGPSDTEKGREKIKERIIDIHAKSHSIYGAPKITHELMKEGYKVSEKTVGNYMRQLGIKAHYIKPYTVTTTNSSLDDKLKNILNRDFNPEKPNAYWCSDITYIWTEEDGSVYITSVMDLFSRKIISWEVSKSLDARSVLSCIDKAVSRRRGARPKIFHTDRGSQFVSYYYYAKLGPNVETSYSRTANPWDNACIESFHALIKREWLDSYRIKNLEHAKLLVFEYIDAFYNTVRIHSHCDYMSPNDYEAKYLEEMEEEIELQEVKLFTLERFINTSLASPIS